MKKDLITYTFILISIFITSCEKMNDNIEKYLDRGEINYIGRVDSVFTFGGKERIGFSWKVGPDPRIEFCKIYWNNNRDSIIYEIDRTQLQNGFVHEIFDQMEEGTYVFNMYHTGSKGYKSIKYEVIGHVYGEQYQASLTPRKIKEVIAYKEKVEIIWNNPEDSHSLILNYTDSSGEINILEVLSSVDTTAITDYKAGGEFSYITNYLPEENAIDQFTVQSEKMNFPSYYELDRTTWKVIDLSSENPTEHMGINILDGNLGTMWHSNWPSPADLLPHSLTIDMQEMKYIDKIYFVREGQRKYLKFATVSISNDNATDWEDIGVISFPDQTDLGTYLELNESKKCRYIKFFMTESFSPPYIDIAEIYVYGKDI